MVAEVQLLGRMVGLKHISANLAASPNQAITSLLARCEILNFPPKFALDHT